MLYFGYHLLNLFRAPHQFDGVFLFSSKKPQQKWTLLVESIIYDGYYYAF